MKKNFLKVLALGMAMALTLSACAQQSAPPASSAPASEAPASSAPASSAPASEAPKAEPVTVNYYSMWNETEAQAEVLKAAIAEYESTTGNKVNVTWVGRDIEKTIRASLDAKEAVDIWDQDIVKQTLQNRDSMLDLTSYFDKKYAVLEDKSLNETMNPALLGLTKSLSGTGVAAVPYQPYTVIFMYNMEHFEKAGITAVPKTWDEFMAVCEKLKAAGFTPTTIDDAYRDLPLGYYLARIKGYEWVRQLMNDKTMWNDPSVLEMAKSFEEMAKKGYWDKNVSSAVWPSGQNEVATGNISMYLTGTWLPNELAGTAGPDFKWGSFNFPTVPGGTLPNTAAMYGSQAFFIPKDSKNADAAFELLATIVSKKYDDKMATDTFGIPISPTGAWTDLMKNIKPTFDETTEWLPWGGGTDGNADTKAVLLPEFAKLIGGEITAEQFVANMSK